MLVGYVSDERYLGTADLLLRFTGERGVVSARSRQRCGSLCRY